MLYPALRSQENFFTIHGLSGTVLMPYQCPTPQLQKQCLPLDKPLRCMDKCKKAMRADFHLG